MRSLILTILVGFSSMAMSAVPDVTQEKILGYQPAHTGIYFQVKSGGCTQREDFRVQSSKDDNGILQLTLLRVRPDTCHPFLPMGIRFKFTYEELGMTAGEPFTILNGNGIVHGSAWDD